MLHGANKTTNQNALEGGKLKGTLKLTGFTKEQADQNFSKIKITLHQRITENQARQYYTITVARLWYGAGSTRQAKILWRQDRGRQGQYIHQGREHRWKQSGIRGDVRQERNSKWPEMRGELLFKIKHEIHKTKNPRRDSPHHGVTFSNLS